MPAFRGMGIGRKMVTFLERELSHMSADKIVLHAQHDAAEFYEKCGFTIEGPFFWEVGIKHVKMEKRL